MTVRTEASACAPARGLLLAAFALLAPGVAAALEFECSAPGDVRTLRLEVPGSDHLCEVSVTGDDGERRVMWYADHETLFCSAKAYELRDRYVGEWGFDCRARPDRDGIDRLSPRQRAILDLQLKSLQARADAGETRLAVSGVRAVASTPLDRTPGMLALQFFLAEGGDLVRIVVDEDGRWTTLAEVTDLATEVTAVPGLRAEAAFVGAIGESGALELVTRLAPADRADADGTIPCEGRQTFRANPDGTLRPDTPHRHVCGGAIEPIPAFAGAD